MTPTIAQSIVNYTNGLLKRQLIFQDITPGGALLCNSKRGSKHVIVVNSSGGRFWIQSVLKVVRPEARYSWLVGGSPGVNTKLIMGWGPGVCYYPTTKEWAEYLDQNYPRENWQKIIGTGALRCPEHIDKEELLAHE